MFSFLHTILDRLRGEVPTSWLIKNGLHVGKNFRRMNGVWIDPGHCWLISFGDNVTLAPRVTILAHDASPQAYMHVTKVGRVSVGNNTFIGAGSIILPGVTIGENVVIGAGSIVSKNVPANTVAAGNPCHPIMSIDEYLEKIKKIDLRFGPQYLYPTISINEKKEMICSLKSSRFGLLTR